MRPRKLSALMIQRKEDDDLLRKLCRSLLIEQKDRKGEKGRVHFKITFIKGCVC